MTAAARLAINWVEQGLVPDAVIRHGIRRLCHDRLREIRPADCQVAADGTQAFIDQLDAAPIALAPELANAQHYEVPAAFYEQVLGPRRKYSCCHWPAGVDDLAAAEENALVETCVRAGIANGQEILELGCGWGSLSLWLAVRYPAAHITAVSNSQSQRAFIEARARDLGLGNLTVLTADMNAFDTPARFDRVVSVEMFEHMRNWPALIGRVHGWLKPGGHFFLHVFCHRDTPYLFEDRGADDWMSRHFFSGGMMPSDDLALRCAGPLRLVRQWRWSGEHYRRTADAWLANLDTRREAILPILADACGTDLALLWLQRWRLFFLACAETFGYDGGDTWYVSHYLFERAGD